MNLSIHLALTLNYFNELCQIPISFFFECNEPILSSLFIFQKKDPNLALIQVQNNIRRTLLTNQKIWNCQQSCLSFFFKSKEFFLITQVINSALDKIKKKSLIIFPIKVSNNFFDMSVLYRKNLNYSF